MVVAILEEKQFDTFIQQPFALVDFWAPWCGPCRALAPVLERLSQEPQVVIGKVNVEEETMQSLVQRYAIRSIPALFFFKSGTCVETHIGSLPEADLREKIHRFL